MVWHDCSTTRVASRVPRSHGMAHAVLAAQHYTRHRKRQGLQQTTCCWWCLLDQPNSGVVCWHGTRRDDTDSGLGCFPPRLGPRPNADAMLWRRLGFTQRNETRRDARPTGVRRPACIASHRIASHFSLSSRWSCSLADPTRIVRNKTHPGLLFRSRQY